jgi:hypothetical protein
MKPRPSNLFIGRYGQVCGCGHSVGIHGRSGCLAVRCICTSAGELQKLEWKKIENHCPTCSCGGAA